MQNGWNVFDFVIITVGLLPFGGQAVTVLRLVRLLRVLKLVRALPKLRILVMGLLKSLSSIAYIGLLLLLLFYLYAVLGVSFFGANDPVHFGAHAKIRRKDARPHATLTLPVAPRVCHLQASCTLRC